MKWQQTAPSSASERQQGRPCWQTPGAVLRPSSAPAHSSSGRAPPGLFLHFSVPPALLDAPPPSLASSGCARGQGPGGTVEGRGARCPAHAAGPGCAFSTSRGTSGRLHPRGPQPRGGEAAASWPRDPPVLAGGPELAGRQKKGLETSPERPRRGDVAPEACACAGASRGAAASWLPPSPGCACARAEVAK